MTREEAISIMNVIVHMLEPKYDTDRVEDAVEMAIKALEQEPRLEDDGTLVVDSEHFYFVQRIRLEHGENRQVYLYKFDLEQEPNTGCWIPISEKLPEDGKRVLITCDGLIRYVKQSTYDKMRGGFCDTCSIKLESDEVIAWMPLPKPYKAESEDKNEV